MEDLKNYFTQQDRIDDLKKRLASQIAQKHKAQKSRDKLIASKIKTIHVLIKLVEDGRCNLTVEEIAGICFITPKSVREAISRYKYKIGT